MQPQNIWNLIEEDTLKMTVKLKQWEMEVSHTDKTVKRKALKRGESPRANGNKSRLIWLHSHSNNLEKNGNIANLTTRK